MTIKEFVEAAVKGGWKNDQDVKIDPKYGLIISWSVKKDHDNGNLGHGMTLLDWTELYLDPEAWLAIGKVMGWSESKFYSFDGFHATGETLAEAQWHFRRFCNELWKGKTIEEALSIIFI